MSELKIYYRELLVKASVQKNADVVKVTVGEYDDIHFIFEYETAAALRYEIRNYIDIDELREKLDNKLGEYNKYLRLREEAREIALKFVKIS